MEEYAGLLGRACPAAVYEYADAEGSEADAAGKKFVINSQNCIHVCPFLFPRSVSYKLTCSARLVQSRPQLRIFCGLVRDSMCF